MDFLSQQTIIVVALALVLLYNIWRIKKSNNKTKILQPPEIPGALPLIGHLHLLGEKTPLARTFASLADKYGPIFQIRQGSYPALVISNQDAIKECFTTNDKVLASRPKSTRGVLLGYNYAGFGFAPYGSFWTKMRKLAVFELFSPRRFDSLKDVYESEIDALIKDLSSYLSGDSPAAKVVVISELLERLSFNVITKMIAGKRFFSYLEDVDNVEAHIVVQLIKDFMHVAGEFVPSDFIPIIGWFCIEGRVIKSMKKMAKDLDTLVGNWVEEHKSMESDDLAKNSCEKQDFIDVMLSVVEDDPATGHTRDNIIKANILNLMLAGLDTTSTTMIWTLSLLLNNKHVLKRAQEEIDFHVGSDTKVESTNIKNLVYLQAIVKETLRLYPPAPLMLPHEARQDCKIQGYNVPKGTRVFANVWKLHRDPRIWSNPEKFSPERFINCNGELDERNNNFDYVPFGAGRRVCPGSTLAIQVSLVTIGRLIHGFDLCVPMDELVDMREGLGLTLPKLTPLEILMAPRVPY